LPLDSLAFFFSFFLDKWGKRLQGRFWILWLGGMSLSDWFKYIINPIHVLGIPKKDVHLFQIFTCVMVARQAATWILNL
jgi:uncharacterized membrane protein